MPIPNSPERHPSPDASVALSPSLSSQLVFPSTIVLCAVFFDVSSRMLVASLERSSLFTVLLQQSLYRHLSQTVFALVFAIGILQIEIVLVAHVGSYILHITVTGLLSLGIYAYLAPVWADVSYMRVRWAAWSGMSRTGIAPRLVKYLPQIKDGWEGMAREKMVSTHPVDKVIVPLWPFGSFSRRYRGISADPTALLVAAQSKNEPISQADVPISSDISIAKSTRPSPSETAGVQLQGYPVNVYRPLRPSKPVSLLWGEQIFFSRRVSRGIISLPRHLLSSYPTLSSGIPAHGLVLAFGMLARNKGLTPDTLVCNLMYLTSLRIFEEYSARYPRPAKTLRSYFRVEMEAAFGALGASYVTAATELAVILSDTPNALILEWLGQNLEHQDLLLNVRAQELGATDEDLDRLYRGSYAAMLVSLNTYTGGKAIRPEILVFEGLCRRERVDLPEWARGHEMRERRRLEVQYCGGEEVVGQLVNTVV